MKEVYDANGVSLSGSLLASLLHEAASPYGDSVNAKGTRYTEGLLFGSMSRRQGSETGDTHEKRAVTHREIVLSAYTRTGRRCSFYDALGDIDAHRLQGLIPPDKQLAGFFVVRKGASTRPSLREIQVFRNLVQSPLASGQPPVLMIISTDLRESVPTLQFRYQCMAQQASKAAKGAASPGLFVLPSRIQTLRHDSSTEYTQLRPSPLPSLGVSKGQVAELEGLYGGVPPPHVRGTEALFDRTMETLDGLVCELKSIENRVARQQLLKKCLLEVALAPEAEPRR
ncbi:unnamed protein product [Discosporangium mesarthrocarpum]